MKNNNSKILWVDYAKGIGVFLVIVGHLWYSSKYPIVNQFIYSFHMPMFFILSGFVYNIYTNISIEKYIKRKFIRILLPTIFYLILGVIKSYFNGIHRIKTLIKLFIFWNGLCPFNSPCWFFIVIFELYIIIYLFKHYLRNKSSSCAFAILCFITGYIIYYEKIPIHFGLDKTIIALGFFSTGAFIRHIYNNLKEKNNNSLLLTILFIISSTLWIIFTLKNDKIAFYKLHLNNYWYSTITGITGTITFSIISYLLSKIKLLNNIENWASNSVFIIGTHYFFVDDYLHLIKNNHILFTKKFALIIPIFSLILLRIYQPICKYLDKKIPFITGK